MNDGGIKNRVVPGQVQSQQTGKTKGPETKKVLNNFEFQNKNTDFMNKDALNAVSTGKKLMIPLESALVDDADAAARLGETGRRLVTTGDDGKPQSNLFSPEGLIGAISFRMGIADMAELESIEATNNLGAIGEKVFSESDFNQKKLSEAQKIMERAEANAKNGSEENNAKMSAAMVAKFKEKFGEGTEKLESTAAALRMDTAVPIGENSAAVLADASRRLHGMDADPSALLRGMLRVADTQATTKQLESLTSRNEGLEQARTAANFKGQNLTKGSGGGTTSGGTPGIF